VFAAGIAVRADWACCGQINPETFDVWMRILQRVPRSVLWLLRLPAGGEPLLRQAAVARGIDPGRLVFSDVFPKVCVCVLLL
jgi:protein O-GlcNAc transferase